MKAFYLPYEVEDRIRALPPVVLDAELCDQLPDVSLRTLNRLPKHHIDTLQVLVDLTPEAFMKLRGIGEQAYQEIVVALERRGLHFAGDHEAALRALSAEWEYVRSLAWEVQVTAQTQSKEGRIMARKLDSIATTLKAFQ